MSATARPLATVPASSIPAGVLGAVRRNAWVLAVLAGALAIGQGPLVLASCCAPTGATGLGTVWFINDFAQYESAMRQGAASSSWAIHDVFTSEPHQPALMFALYVAIGKLAAAVQVDPMLVERGVEVLSRALFVLALWRFCQAFARGPLAARAACLLALFGSGLEVFAAALGLAYTGNWSYETNSFGLLFAAPHVPLAMAATLELARGWLRPVQRLSLRGVLVAAVLGAAIALLHPFHEPVLLAALLLAGLVFWRSGQGAASLAGALAAGLGALPVLWTTVDTFSFDPFWVATYSSQNQLPTPPPHALVVELGVTLILALVAVVLARGRSAPFGLLLWLLLSLVAMYAPVPYQRRLGFGLQPALAVLAGNGLVLLGVQLRRRWAVAMRLGVAGLAASGSVLVLVSAVSSGLRNQPLPVYRSTTDLDAAAAWLQTHVAPSDTILADWNVSNYLGPRTPARVYGGHPVATLHAAQKQFVISTVFAHGDSLAVARQLAVQWLVYGPLEASLRAQGAPAFQSGVVRVYRVPARSSSG